MTYACAHRLRRGNDIVGASGGQEWALKELEPGVPLPPLDCFFPAGNEGKLHGTLDVWLFRTREIQEMPREQWIGTITFTPDIPRHKDCWVDGQEHIMMRIHLDGHGSEEGERCECGALLPAGWESCPTCASVERFRE
jgi:hypothetical protein